MYQSSIFLPSSPVIPTTAGVLALEPGVVKMSTVEIFPVIPFERGAIVSVVEPIAIVSFPGRIVIIGITREIIFIHNRGWSISLLVYRSRSIFIIDRSGSGCIGASINNGRSHGNTDPGNPETNTGVYIYL